jgi:hypothetical protein
MVSAWYMHHRLIGGFLRASSLRFYGDYDDGLPAA